jgi:O-antigen/teichoic acid export membrane protein
MDLSRLFYRALLRLLLSNAVVKSVWILGIDRWVQNEVGAFAYGRYFTVWGLVLTAGFLLDLGLTTLIQREAATQKADIRSLARLFWLKSGLLVVYFLAITTIGYFNTHISVRILWGVAFIQALNSFYIYFRAWVTALQDYAADVWFSVLDKLLLIPVCYLWLSGLGISVPLTVDTFIVLQLITLLISTGVVLVHLVRKRVRLIVPFYFSGAQFRSAWPYALIVLLMSAHARLDGYWISLWSETPEQEAGRYAAAYRLLDASNMFGYLVASFLLPYLSRHGVHQSLARLAIGTARRGLLFFSCSALLFVCVFNTWLASFLSADEGAAVGRLLPIVFAALLGYSLTHVYGTVLTARGDLNAFHLILLGGLLLHILFSAFWVPQMGALGAARSAMLTHLLTGLSLMYIVHRRDRSSQPYTSYLVVIFTSCLVWFLS